MSETVQTLILTAHIMVGILLVTIILIQRGKGSDAGMAFGGGASGTVFGATGSGTFLTKTTKWLAIAFFCTSLALAYVHNNRAAPESIIDRVELNQDGALPEAAELPGLEITPNNLPDVPAAIDETMAPEVPPAVEEQAEPEGGE